MYHYQLMLAKDWENQQAEQKNNPLTLRYAHCEFSTKKIVHFYQSGYDDIVKELVANPDSCKDFYPVLQKVGLPYQSYYHRVSERVAQVLQNALFENRVVLLPRVYNGSHAGESNQTSNHFSQQKKTVSS